MGIDSLAVLSCGKRHLQGADQSGNGSTFPLVLTTRIISFFAGIKCYFKTTEACFASLVRQQSEFKQRLFQAGCDWLLILG